MCWNQDNWALLYSNSSSTQTFWSTGFLERFQYSGSLIATSDVTMAVRANQIIGIAHEAVTVLCLKCLYAVVPGLSLTSTSAGLRGACWECDWNSTWSLFCCSFWHFGWSPRLPAAHRLLHVSFRRESGARLWTRLSSVGYVLILHYHPKANDNVFFLPVYEWLSVSKQRSRVPAEGFLCFTFLLVERVNRL